MPRKRKRPEWPQLVYKFAVEPYVIPQEMWDVARAQHDVWCRLAKRHRRIREVMKRQHETETADKERHSQTWEAFNHWARWLARRLHWELADDILDRFRIACTTAAKDPKRGWPKPGPMSKINLLHRYTGGGQAVEKLNGRAHRFRLPVTVAGDTIGSFGLYDTDKTSIEFRAFVHRAVPVGAIAKRVQWCGVRDVFGWHWSICVQIEIPPRPSRVKTGAVAGLDVGWRKRDDGIRVAVVSDSIGDEFEFVLPFDFSTSETRKHNSRQRSGWVRIPDTYAELAELQRLIDVEKDAAKEAVREATGIDVTRWGKRALRKFMHDERIEESQGLADRLADWSDRDRTLSRRHAAAWQSSVGRRRWFYRNFAAWLCQNYDSLAIEQGIGIKDMLEAENKGHALDAGDRCHQWAATSELLLYIKQAAAKHGVEIVGDLKHTTDRCCDCGGNVEPGPKLLLACEHGHVMDQDVNAARNLRSQIEGAFSRKATLRNLPHELGRIVRYISRAEEGLQNTVHRGSR